MGNRYLIGVDIGGTTVKIAIISHDGEIHNKWEIPTRLENAGANIPADIWESITKKLSEANIEKTNVDGMGVGAPGFIIAETGTVANAVNIGWKNFELGKELEGLSGLPVFVNNDANIAALGENWLGAGNLDENFIAITLGTGVGGGLIANGQIISGTNGTAGEIGHVTVEPGGAPCNCGRYGCLETVTSATGIVRQAKAIIDAGIDSKLQDVFKNNGEITSRDVFEMAEAGDVEAQKIVDHVADVLGMAISNAAILINPSKVVIGGGVSKAGDQLIKPLKAAFSKHTLGRIDEGCEFELAELGNDAGVIGGAYLAKMGIESVN